MAFDMIQPVWGPVSGFFSAWVIPVLLFAAAMDQVFGNKTVTKLTEKVLKMKAVRKTVYFIIGVIAALTLWANFSSLM